MGKAIKVMVGMVIAIGGLMAFQDFMKSDDGQNLLKALSGSSPDDRPVVDVGAPNLQISAEGNPSDKEIRLLNKGDDVRIIRVVINKRRNNPACIMPVNQTLHLGDGWSGHPDYSCGELVRVDIETNKGVDAYQVN